MGYLSSGEDHVQVGENTQPADAEAFIYRSHCTGIYYGKMHSAVRRGSVRLRRQGGGRTGVLIRTISGDLNRCSLFALGISPYMMGSILVQMISLCRKAWSKDKVSPRKTNQAILAMTLVLAALQAFFQVQALSFCVPDALLLSARMVSGLEMVTGAMLIVWLSARNKNTDSADRPY